MTDEEELDVDVAVELVNTEWVLADPPDRLTEVEVFRDVLRDLGRMDLAEQLKDSDLERLRRLRLRLHPVFAAGTPEEMAALLNPWLREVGAVPQLVTGECGRLELHLSGARTGIDRLECALPVALAAHAARHDVRRLGVCQAAPCRCVYVDRTRPATRRYCCDACNDRVAARAYRRRRR
jgi:predicted RNA-binding Zn ribbon-like protein